MPHPLAPVPFEILLVAFALCFAACAGPGASPPGTGAEAVTSAPSPAPTAEARPGEATTTRTASDESGAAAPTDQEPVMSNNVRGPAEPGPPIRGFEVTPVDDTQGEDGHGQLVPAQRPVALDVLADAWPGRALDPVLYVGQVLVFRHYRHPGPGVLRFVAADADSLPSGEAVYLQWGDDQRSRVEVTSTLEVPR
jgi:hypothetical protein